NYPLFSSPGTTLNSTQSLVPLPICGLVTTVSDVWYTFTKPVGITNFELFTDSLDCRGAAFKTGIEVYASCGGIPVDCDFGSTGPLGTNASSYLNIHNQPCSAQQYWVRVYTADTTYRGYFRFNIKPPGRNCSSAVDITACGIPYSSPVALTTCGFGFDYDSTNSEPHSQINSGEDYVFTYTPLATICVDFSLTNAAPSQNPGIFIYEGCPNSGTCIGYAANGNGTPLNFYNVSLTAGVTYYFVVESDSTNYNQCIFFNFGISFSSGGASMNDVCASSQNLPVVSSASCTGTINYNDNCASPTSVGIIQLPTCGNFTDGVTPDVWFTFTSTGTSTHRITANAGTTLSAQDLAMAVYTGTCVGMTLVGCDDNSNSLMPSLAVFPPAAGTVYFVRIWSNNGSQPGNFKVCVVDGCTPINDFCSGAIPLIPGHYAQGDNTCASGINEPFSDTSATCWTNLGGITQLNTVWYSFVAINDTMKIRLHLLTLYDSQIALYSSSSGCSGNFNELLCNDNALSTCFIGTNSLSQITATGLNVGATYYVRVDGVNEYTGTFEIIVQPELTEFPPLYAQDCPLAINLCNNNQIKVPDHTYTDMGNICDILPWASCLQNGDRNGVFYKFNVTGGLGVDVEFTITPNGIGNCDFMLWCIDTVYGNGDQIPAVSNYCSMLPIIAAFPGYICSYSASSISGCNNDYGTINMPGFYSTSSVTAPGISPAIYVPPGMTATFILCVTSDYHANGFTLDWMGTPIDPIPPFLQWQNSSNSNWTDSVNWNSAGCSIPPGSVPDCINQIPSIIMSGPSMPVITSNIAIADITINSGASLTIDPGITLVVCGNFIDNGALICGSGSTVKFVGNRNTSISGDANIAFWNVEFAKDSGAILTLGKNISIRGNDSLYSGILNNNGHSTSVGGNFYNYNGNSSFNGFGNAATVGALIFNSPNGMPQHFRNDGSLLTLNDVYINQTTASFLTLDTNSTSNLLIGAIGHLTLTKGKIITNTSHEVIISNNSDVACSSGNTLSYVEGNLRRAIDTIASNYDFPIGDSIKGYQRFSIVFRSAPTTTYNILAKFKRWIGLPVAPPDSECVGLGYAASPVFDNGYWTLDASDTNGLGIYNAHAYPRNVANNVGSCFSLMQSLSNNGQGPWSMQGLVTITSSSTQIIRDSLVSFSDFAVVQDYGILSSSSDDDDDDLNSVKNDFRFSVLPNPASEKITLTFNSPIPQIFYYSLKDVTGRLLINKNINASKELNSFDVNILGIAKGIYLLTLENKNQQSFTRLIVQ
ncbi:MAG: T9SS type A sorting domain-containing protein, partial [Bacteroidota bacterium]